MDALTLEQALALFGALGMVAGCLQWWMVANVRTGQAAVLEKLEELRGEFHRDTSDIRRELHAEGTAIRTELHHEATGLREDIALHDAQFADHEARLKALEKR